MTHWGWYWRVKKKHTPKALCSQFACLDSFQFFKTNNPIGFNVPSDRYTLQAVLQDEKFVVSGTHNYEIALDKRSARFGGFYRFLICPCCKASMRKLYCCQGIFLCRKCLKIGYYSQRISPCLRYGHMQEKIEGELMLLGGDVYNKPKWMRKKTFESLRNLHYMYERMKDVAYIEETIQMFGCLKVKN